MSGPRVRAAVMAAIAAAGVCAGHLLDYLLVAGRHTDTLLHRAGHGYFGAATIVALAAASAALAAVAVGVFRSAARSRRREPVVITWLRLTPIQAGAFASLEIVERLATGGSWERLVVLLALGVLLQAMVAFVLAMLLAGVSRLAAAAGRRTPARQRSPESGKPFPEQRELARRWRLAASIMLRGPPLVASAPQ